MFVEHWNETMRRFVNELKLNHQRKQAAAAAARAIDCMELEDRILLSAAPIAPQLLVGQTGGGATDGSADSQGGGRQCQRQPRRRLVDAECGRELERQGAAVQFGRDRRGRPD